MGWDFGRDRNTNGTHADSLSATLILAWYRQGEQESRVLMVMVITMESSATMIALQP